MAVFLAVRSATGATPPHLSAEDLTAAVRFEEDRDTAQRLATARDALRRGDRGSAVAVLQDVLDGGSTGLVSTADGYRSALLQAWQLLRESPELIDHYQRHSGGAALSELHAALAGENEQELRDVVLRFRFTEAGQQALETLAERRLDSARFPEAATLYEELILGAPDPAQQSRRHPAALHAWALSLHKTGRDQEALAVATAFFSAVDESSPFAPLLNRLQALIQAAVSGSENQERPDVIRWLPSMHAEWEFAFPPGDAVPRETADGLLPEFGTAGIAPRLSSRPLEVRGSLIIRTMPGVIRLDTGTGEPVWRWPGEPDAPASTPRAGGLLASRESLRLLEAAIGDSVHAGLVADRDRVYFLQEALDDSGPEGGPPVRNSLIAVNVDTGEEVWARGNGQKTGGDEDFRDVFFRGAPAVHGDELLIVGERAASVELFVLDSSTGLLNWSVKLCVPAASPVRDDRRLAQECRVLLTAGKAVCPTGGGGLVAVDLLSRAVWWAFRYPREPLTEDDVGSRSQAQTRRQLVWADSWSASHLSERGGRIVLASGESDALHVLHSRNGGLLWSRPRHDVTHVAGVTDEHVILVHPHRVSAVGLNDGAGDWSVAVDQPAGRGCVMNGHYLFPLLRGGVAAVRLTDGNLTRTCPPDDARPRVAVDADLSTATNFRPVTFTQVGGHVVEQSLDGVRQLADLGDALDRAAKAAANDPGDVDLVIRHAGHLHEAADFRAAADLLLARYPDGDDAPRREQLRRLALEALLGATWWSHDPSGPADAAEQLLDTDADRVRFQICRLRNDVRDVSPAAIDSALQLLDLRGERFFLERGDGTGWVRLDRQVQAWLGQVLGQAGEPTRMLLSAALTEALQERGARSGDTEAHRLLSALDHVAAAQHLRVQLPPRWSTTDEFIRHELELEQLATHANKTLAAGALAALMELYEAHSDYRLAARTFRRLESLAAEGSLATTLPDVPEDSPLRRWLDDPSLPPWPSREPDVTSTPGVNDDAIYFTHPEIVAESPALIDGLTVSVARNGSSLRFSGGVWSQQWDVDLPSVRGYAELMRNEVFADLRRGWTFGNLLVMQIGGNVYGVAPLDRNGEPSAELIWPAPGEQISTGERVAQFFTHPQSEAPRPHGFVERRLLLDARLQPVGHVGPVRRGYFCVRRSGELTAYRTATGARLWTRSGLAPAARCEGDDKHLVLIRPDSPEVTLLRAIDGAQIGSYEWALHDAELLHCYGCRGLVMETSGPSGPRLNCSDLTTGESVWSRPVAGQCVCFPVDDNLCGLLEPDGTVRLIELASGEDFAVQQVQRPDPLTGVRTILDEDALFLLITKPIDDPAIQATIRPDGNSPNTGFRNFEVNGGLHAFERETGQLRWSREVDNAVALLDQARDVPILVFKEIRIREAGSSLLQNRMRVIDKRTGEILLDESSGTPYSRYVVQRNRAEGWIEVRCPDRNFRFNYAERADAEPAP